MLKDADQDRYNPNNVIGIYSGISIYKHNQDFWNREHIWSKSHGNFGTLTGAGTDAHHLRAENPSVNTLKNNLDFDSGGNAVPNAPGCFYDSDSWEPRDAVKGDIARMIFYMATRYQGENGEPNLSIVDYVNTSPNNEPLYGKLSTLLIWNAQDPVDALEMNRNNIVYYYQNNRNPYIDHPEWVTSIWGGPPVGISDKNDKYVSTDYKLNQNYPNPFNPSTSISFYIPAESYVTLSVYNTIGQKIETLYEGNRQAGSHKLNWNARNLASGIYYYTIDAVSHGNQIFHSAKKMILVK
jgi:endonuclease I